MEKMFFEVFYSCSQLEMSEFARWQPSLSFTCSYQWVFLCLWPVFKANDINKARMSVVFFRRFWSDQVNFFCACYRCHLNYVMHKMFFMTGFSFKETTCFQTWQTWILAFSQRFKEILDELRRLITSIELSIFMPGFSDLWVWSYTLNMFWSHELCWRGSNQSWVLY